MEVHFKKKKKKHFLLLLLLSTPSRNTSNPFCSNPNPPTELQHKQNKNTDETDYKRQTEVHCKFKTFSTKKNNFKVFVFPFAHNCQKTRRRKIQRD
ncbi:hypothetical protein Patl1_13983 [Pistacia atlantica]|uniref:Uncharacterized protein n=1 Tax=Pistacia atlantica TaxID=434234 RepID=A0ACC1ATE1_9ROSI|nr:hypothetical protein Patl1_13983 [Pistacia atlantica]